MFSCSLKFRVLEASKPGVPLAAVVTDHLVGRNIQASYTH